MDTERISALLCAIEERSLTAAAEKLGYTTSGVSRMMAALEKETGFPLLVRSRNGVVPTEECRQLLPLMQEMLALADRYDQLSGELVGLTRGRIRIGTSYYAYYDWFARLIAEFRRSYPGIAVQIIEGTSTELIGAMEEHQADLCIISRRPGSYDWIPLKPDNSQMLQRNGITPQIRYSTSDNYAAYAMVAAGLGVTCTNAIIGESFKEGVRYLPLSPRQPVEIGIAIPKKKEMSPAARRFAEFARAYEPASS